MNLTDIVLGSASGGLLGLVGSLATGVLNFFQTKQKNAHDLAMVRENRETQKMLGDLKQAELAGALAALRERGASEAFNSSIRADAEVRSGWKWSTVIRELTRPALTWYFTILTSIFIGCVASGVIALQTIQDPLLQYCVVFTINTTGMMISWWFGQRQIDKVTIAWGNKTAGASVGPKP